MADSALITTTTTIIFYNLKGNKVGTIKIEALGNAELLHFAYPLA